MDIIPRIVSTGKLEGQKEYIRISKLMDAGNEARRKTGDNSILALGAASLISSNRQKESNGSSRHKPRQAYIVSSLKHPEEVREFRNIYPQGFYLLGVYSDEERRKNYLMKEKLMKEQEAKELILRDQDERLPHGQHVTDTFHLSDFFVKLDGDEDQLKNSIWRILEILFSHPYKTPTFNEYSMFLAFAASLRSADLSRQVGAVIAKNNEILATGANDCPRYGGGLYWPELNIKTKNIEDKPGGRDYKRGEDSNKAEQNKLINEILEKASEKNIDKETLRAVLRSSRIDDLTEFGRVVHAEMEALLCCARNSISTHGATLYCTTFPCHNCAKHIIAAGIERVVYIEPYQKSKAAEFHNDSIVMGFEDRDDAVRFEPFVGIGPRRFFDLFSQKLGSGYPIKRNIEGRSWVWQPGDACLRLQMLPCSYLDLESIASNMFYNAQKMEER